MRPDPLLVRSPLMSQVSQPAPYATIHPNHPDLIVSFGQATFDAEGLEAQGPYFSRVIHWPGGNSGVTIGRGYDMGQRTRLQVLSELRHAGVSEQDAVFLAGAAGVRGERAQRFVQAFVGESPVLSLPSQRRLFEVVTTPEILFDIRRILAKPDLQKRYGAVAWGDLTPMAQEVVFDLRYRGDYTPLTRERLQPILVARDDGKLLELLADSAYWRAVNVPESRTQARFANAQELNAYRLAS